MIHLIVLGHALLNNVHWLALCTHMLVRYANRDFFYTCTQLKYYNKYALEITYNWLSFIPCKLR